MAMSNITIYLLTNLLESGKIIFADNLIHNINHFFTNNELVYLESVTKVDGNSSSKNCPDSKSSDESVKNASSNSLFQIKKVRRKNASKVIIVNLNIKSLPNKFEQLKELC